MLPSSETAREDMSPNRAAIVLLAILLFITMVRIRLLDLPLERDEGEYAYAGQLLLDGVAPYSLVYNMKFPGTYGAYAFLMAMFGQTIGGIRLGLILVSGATTLLLYFLASRLFDRVAGVSAAAAHAILAVTITAMGPYAHAMHFVALPVVAAMLLLVPPRGAGSGQDSRDEPPIAAGACLGAGALLALAVLMKQPGAAFGLFAGAWLLFLRPRASETPRMRDMAMLGAGSAAVIAALFGTLYAAGVFRQFWFWTIDYAREYVTNQSLVDGAEALRDNLFQIVRLTPLLWIAAVLGAVLLVLEPAARRQWKFVIGFLIASIAAVMPGFYFRPHYFLILFPAVALLVGVAVSAGCRMLAADRRSARPLLAGFAVVILVCVAQQWSVWMNTDLQTITRFLYGTDPFPEAITVADYLREHTRPADRIAVIGSEPEIYFYAGRKSATGYIYTYALMEIQKFAGKMQNEMMAEIDRADPLYLVMVSGSGSWIRRTSSQMLIFDWLQKKVARGYVTEGVVEIANDGTTHAVWGTDAQTYKPQTRNLITIYRRVRGNGSAPGL